MIPVLILSLWSFVAAANGPCEPLLGMPKTVRVPRRHLALQLNHAEALALSQKLLRNIQEAARLAKAGKWDKAFDILDDPKPLEGSGLSLIPFQKRHELFYTPTSHEDLQRKLQEEIVKNVSIAPMVSFHQGKVRTWIVLPEGDNPGPEIWEILNRDRILELSEELGHVAQVMQEFATGQLSISEYHRQRDEFAGFQAVVEADIYAFLLETYGPDFVPSSYMGTFEDVRRPVDEALRPR
ncbi:MAG: hypothetical protein AB7F86_05200 [Bdellovibrionales bacterium]